MGRALLGLAVAVGGLGLWLVKLLATEVIKREYDSWAPALARALVHIACRLHPDRAHEWRGELHACQVDGSAGVDYALAVVLSSGQFATRRVIDVRAAGGQWWSRLCAWEDRRELRMHGRAMAKYFDNVSHVRGAAGVHVVARSAGKALTLEFRFSDAAAAEIVARAARSKLQRLARRAPTEASRRH